MGADSHPVEFIDRARNVAILTVNLASYVQRCHRSTTPDAARTLRIDLARNSQPVLDVLAGFSSDELSGLPPRLHPIRVNLQSLGKVVRKWHATASKSPDNSLGSYPDLHTVAIQLHEAIKTLDDAISAPDRLQWTDEDFSSAAAPLESSKEASAELPADVLHLDIESRAGSVLHPGAGSVRSNGKIIVALWRTSLQRIQTRFQRAAEQGMRLKGYLIQSFTPRLTARPRELPGVHQQAISFGSGASFEGRQLFNQDGSPMIGDRVLLDATGKPMVFSDGTPIAFERGFSRSHQYYSQVREAFIQYKQIADDAGVVIERLPRLVEQVLWMHLPIGTDLSRTPESLWTDVLFELAWQRFPGSTLSASKFAWSGQTSVALEAVEKLRSIMPQAIHPEITSPPDHWYSMIEDLFTASLSAIDILCSIQCDMAPPDTGVPADQVDPVSGAAALNDVSCGDAAIPPAIMAIPDLALRQRTAEAWSATTRLIDCILPWSEWVAKLRDTGDADPGLAMTMGETADLNLGILFELHVKSDSFIDTSKQDILNWFPVVPGGELARPAIELADGSTEPSIPAWQDSYDLADAWERLSSLNQFEGELRRLKYVLENAPTAAFVGSGIVQNSPNSTSEANVPNTPTVAQTAASATDLDNRGARSMKPRWDRGKRKLLYKDMVVKAFRHAAKNQFRVLDAFEELGWPAVIDDPMPRSNPKNGREIDAVERVQETAKSLNQGMTEHSPIVFSTNGNGTGFSWSLIENSGDAPRRSPAPTPSLPA